MSATGSTKTHWPQWATNVSRHSWTVRSGELRTRLRQFHFEVQECSRWGHLRRHSPVRQPSKGSVTFLDPATITTTTTDVIIAGQIQTVSDVPGCQFDFRF